MYYAVKLSEVVNSYQLVEKAPTVRCMRCDVFTEKCSAHNLVDDSYD
jgi:hypothetical protein